MYVLTFRGKKTTNPTSIMTKQRSSHYEKDWTYYQISELISLYRTSDVLWNKWNKEYHRNLVKQSAWKQIASKFPNRTVDACRSKMENLLTVYRRTKKNYEFNSLDRSGNVTKPKWPYFEMFESFMGDEFSKMGNEMDTNGDNIHVDSQSSDVQYLEPEPCHYGNDDDDVDVEEDTKAFLQISYSPPTFDHNSMNHLGTQDEDQSQEEEESNTNCYPSHHPIESIESMVSSNHQHQHQTSSSSTSSFSHSKPNNPHPQTISIKQVFDLYQEKIQKENHQTKQTNERIQLLETKLETIEQKHRDEIERIKVDHQKELRMQKEMLTTIYLEKIQFLEEAIKELRKEKNELFQVVIKRLS